MIKKTLIYLIAVFAITNCFSQDSKDEIKLNKKKSLLSIENIVNKSFKNQGERKLLTSRNIIQKEKSSTLKSIKNKIEISNLVRKPNSKYIFNKTNISATKGKKKLIRHTPVKNRALSEKVKLNIKRTLGY